MQGSVRAMLGITSGAVSQRRISEASRRVAPHAFQARTFDTLQGTNPIPYFAPHTLFFLIRTNLIRTLRLKSLEK